MEFERRWSAVRAAMAERGIDVLVVQNSNEFSGGYVKWLTDIPAGNGTMTTVIMPKDDLMTVVAPGPFGVRRSPCLVARRVLIIKRAERNPESICSVRDLFVLTHMRHGAGVPKRKSVR
jgi:hypothetical protein